MQGIPCVVDPDPPSDEGLCSRVGDDVRGVRDPLLDFINEVHSEVVVQRKPGSDLLRRRVGSQAQEQPYLQRFVDVGTSEGEVPQLVGRAV